jgi:anti-sigma factor ChrR (cupin superfamily)
MTPKLAALKADENAILGLRLMKCFLKLQNRAHVEEVIALAEHLLSEESKYPAKPDDR